MALPTAPAHSETLPQVVKDSAAERIRQKRRRFGRINLIVVLDRIRES